MICFAWTERALVYFVKVRIFNNVLYMRYVHLTKAKHIIRDKPILSLERKVYKDYDRNVPIDKKKKNSYGEL
jgi:hypothetical protein